MENKCPVCGAPLTGNKCEYCGYEKTTETQGTTNQSANTTNIYINGMNGGMQAIVSPKSRLVALLLVFFIGVFGAHRFYVGKTGTAILYIFTGGLFGVGVIYDFVMIVLGNFKDNRGLPLHNW